LSAASRWPRLRFSATIASLELAEADFDAPAGSAGAEADVFVCDIELASACCPSGAGTRFALNAVEAPSAWSYDAPWHPSAKTHVAKATGTIPAACNRCFGHRLWRMKTPYRNAAQNVTVPRGDAGFNGLIGWIRWMWSSMGRRRIDKRKGDRSQGGRGRGRDYTRRLIFCRDGLSPVFAAPLRSRRNRPKRKEVELSLPLTALHASGLDFRSVTKEQIDDHRISGKPARNESP
jgi:hypothetical protein